MTTGFDLGIAGRTALVCGSSAGLGHACAVSLARAGVFVTLNGRNHDTLKEAANSIHQETGVKTDFVVGDVSRAEGRETIIAACPEPDILVNNGAGPPPGSFEDWGEAEWQDAVRVSMVSPIMMIRALIGPMKRKGWGRIINITSSAVKSPLPLLGLSNGARSGLTGFIAGLAREVADKGVTINNLLPGRFETGRLKSYVAKVAAQRGVSFEQAAHDLSAANPMRRFGRPEEFGAMCAFIASAAYLNGQNILLDGGEFPGTF
ncbi:MAG: SDR family NAD(P)-dependent oxidoreductase [Alphaproteobacteria bacterium]